MKRIRLALATPYVGLRPFTEAEALLFFGRDAHVRELLARLQRRQRFLAVLGASGSGKSSLVRAGLIPALHRGALVPEAPQGEARGLARWNVCIFAPGDAPLANLAQALTGDPRWADGGDIVDARAALAAALGNGPLSLADLYRRKAGQFGGEALLLVVDQFEEIFRYRQRNPDEADRFVKLLLRTAAEPLPIYVVMTMRSDFLGQAVAVQGLAEAINSGIYLTPRLDAEEIRAVVTAPLALVGGRIDPVLATRLLNTLAGDDELPVLQHALLRMWDRARRAGRSAIEAEDFAAVCAPRDDAAQGAGEPALGHAIDNHASEIFEGLTPQQQAVARSCFPALAERREGRDVRRPQTLRELQALVPEDRREAVAAVVEAYRAPGVGFLLPPAAKPLGLDDPIDISHESLIRRWRRFQAWLGEEEIDVAELREWDQRARRRAQGGGWLDGNDGRRAQDWRARVAARVVAAPWAARYCDAGTIERVDAYIEASLDELRRQRADEEALRREAEEARFRRFEAEAQMQREAAARAQADKARAEQEKAQALEAAAANRRHSRMAMAGAGLCLVLAAAAGWSWRQAAQERLRAEAGELAAIAEIEARRDPDLGLLLALEVWRTAPVPRALGLLRAAQAAYPYRSVLRGHGDRVTSAQFSTDGKTVLTTSVDHTARLWDAASGREQQTLPTTHALTVVGAQFSPDRATVLTWSEDGSAQLSDLAGGRPLRVLPGRERKLDGAQFVDGGRRVLTTEDGSARLWDARSGALLQLLAWREAAAADPLPEPDGQLVRISADEKGARLASQAFAGGWFAQRFLREQAEVVRQSADGRRAITVGVGGAAAIWELGEGQLPRIRTRLEPDGRVNDAWLSPDGATALTLGSDLVLQLFREGDIRPRHLLSGHEGRVTSARFSADGRRLVTTDAAGAARVWDVATGIEMRVLRGHGGIIDDAAFSPDGEAVVTASRDRTARLWDLPARDAPRVLRGHAGAVHAVELSPDGKRLLSAGDDRTARVWEAASGAPLQVLRGHDGPVRSVQMSPDGRTVLTAGDDATARLWDLASGRESRILRGHEGTVFDARFSPDGTQVLTAGGDRSVRLWPLEAGGEPKPLAGHAGPVFSARFSVDGRTVLTASDDKIVRLQDRAGDRPARELPRSDRQVLFADFSANGSSIVTASADGTARLWDAGSMRELRSLWGHKGAVRSAVLSADGRTVMTAGDDKTVRLWDAASGVELLVLRGHAKAVLSARFAPDGRTLVSAGGDGTLRLWVCEACLQAVDPEALAARVGRVLSDEERQRHGLRPGF